MVGNLAVQAEAAEPSVRKVEMDFLAQAALGADETAMVDNAAALTTCPQQQATKPLAAR